MKNPKVGKAEILESVVHFLKAEKDMKGEKGSKLQRPGCSRQQQQQAYHDGRTSCLMRISHFISSKSKDAMAPAEESAVQPSLALPQSRLHSRHACAAQVHTPVCDSPLSHPQWLQQQHAVAHPPLTVAHTRCDTQELFPPLKNQSEPVWRPWPQ